MLETRSLSFGYDRQVPVISEWSAAFAPGRLTAVTGPSGRGKSTLLYLLGLMLKPDAGQVLLDGTDVASLSDAHRASLRAHRFGFVFQDAALDSTRTVLDNVAEAALYRAQPIEAAHARAQELLARFGVELRADAKPGQVSGGQAQRIALCRALLNDPDIVLADEPTGNLDAASAALVVDALKEHAAHGATVVIVTHDQGLVAECDGRMEL